jgi:hypothetical protein
MAASSKPSFLRSIVLLALIAWAANAWAEPTPGVTTFWRCWYNGDLRVACVLRDAGNMAVDAALVEKYRGASLPGVIKATWTEPAQLDGLTVMIPLFTDPEEWPRVELLSQSVVCGAKANCMVAFHQSFAEAAMLDPLLLP